MNKWMKHFGFMQSIAIILTFVFFVFGITGCFLSRSAKKPPGCWIGDCVNGKGFYSYPSGSYYNGQFVNSKRHGYGEYRKHSGSGNFPWKYIGEWNNNQRHGKGVMKYRNGKTVSGTWRNDKFIEAAIAPTQPSRATTYHPKSSPGRSQVKNPEYTRIENQISQLEREISYLQKKYDQNIISTGKGSYNSINKTDLKGFLNNNVSGVNKADHMKKQLWNLKGRKAELDRELQSTEKFIYQ